MNVISMYHKHVLKYLFLISKGKYSVPWNLKRPAGVDSRNMDLLLSKTSHSKQSQPKTEAIWAQPARTQRKGPSNSLALTSFHSVPHMPEMELHISV